MVNITYDFTTGFFPWGTNTSLRKANDLVTFPTTVSSSPTLQCKLIIKSSLLFLNPLVAALWKGNTYPFLRCSIIPIYTSSVSDFPDSSPCFLCFLIIPQSLLLDSLLSLLFPWFNLQSFSQSTFSFAVILSTIASNFCCYTRSPNL